MKTIILTIIFFSLVTTIYGQRTTARMVIQENKEKKEKVKIYTTEEIHFMTNKEKQLFQNQLNGFTHSNVSLVGVKYLLITLKEKVTGNSYNKNTIIIATQKGKELCQLRSSEWKAFKLSYAEVKKRPIIKKPFQRPKIGSLKVRKGRTNFKISRWNVWINKN